MPKLRDIPKLKASFLKLYDAKLITPGVFLASVEKLEALETKERRRILSISKRLNDRRLAENEIDNVQWFANWQAICKAREALDA